MEQNNNQNPYENPYQDQDYYQMNDAYEVNGGKTAYGVDTGARVNNILTKSFLFMFIALGISAISADMVYYWIRFHGLTRDLFYVMMVSAVAELVLVLVGNRAVLKGNIVLGGVLLAIYSVLNGITLSTVLIVYDIGMVFATFISTALVFGVMAFIGVVTKKDLGTWGRVGIMLLTGIIITTLVNTFFIKSVGLDMVISYVGLAVFIGLTAYDTQKIKQFAMVMPESEVGDTAIGMAGALQLYLDFINIFLYLIRIFGRRSK